MNAIQAIAIELKMKTIKLNRKETLQQILSVKPLGAKEEVCEAITTGMDHQTLRRMVTEKRKIVIRMTSRKRSDCGKYCFATEIKLLGKGKNILKIITW